MWGQQGLVEISRAAVAGGGGIAGLTRLHDWQQACLLCNDVRRHDVGAASVSLAAPCWPREKGGSC